MTWDATYEEERRQLMERIKVLDIAHRTAIEPILRRLAEIEELRPKVIYVPFDSVPQDVLARLGFAPD